MKQLMQDFRDGSVYVEEVPAPLLNAKGALVRTRYSLVSAGTERAAFEFAARGLIGKARSRPDLVRQVIRTIAVEGVISAYRASMSRLNTPLPIGYSTSGEVIAVGGEVSGLRAGDRVACAGVGYASHAEINYVPRNLMARIPEGVSYEDAAFATLGSIALQGIRLADLALGERVAVIGLGLLGLLTVQLAKAAGCSVLATDLSGERVALALDLGADVAVTADRDGLIAAASSFTHDRGMDAVLITAATTGNEPTQLAGEISRLKGRVVAVGDVGMNIPRSVYYAKELEYRISRSYGPGRYDPEYEEKGVDYPYAYVPFTEQRNMDTFLGLVKEGKVFPNRLVSHRFPIDGAEEAYRLLAAGSGDLLGVLFEYPEERPVIRRVDVRAEKSPRTDRAVKVGLIGAGDYARLVLLPHLSRMGNVELVGVSTKTGISCRHVAGEYGFGFCATDNDEVLDSEEINTVIIATRHDLHSRLVCEALRKGKHVFVEKPLATHEEGLGEVVEAYSGAERILMVGFNRRFAPLAVEARSMFTPHVEPLSMLCRVNAGAIAGEHWVQDMVEGGGRIVGEVCHFIDLLQYFCGAKPASVHAAALGTGKSEILEDNVAINVRFEDGSIGNIAYYSNGNTAVPKEYIEIHGEGKTYIIDDFRGARYARGGRVRRLRTRKRDKGQRCELEAFTGAVRGEGGMPIPMDEMVAATLATFRVIDSLRHGREFAVDWTEEGNPGP
ncbi:MAG: oxidoreductase [Actinobacteria bacterium]|jgi:predicted dehydrogenase/threonine dehydrogenase-like Zn-dependent dehydrogenase|nr:MAG: oxidoreductase [Actinomycetota bacterium]